MHNPEAIKLANEPDFSKVHKADRSTVRNIVCGIMQYENPMPVLKVEIWSSNDHYNCTGE